MKESIYLETTIISYHSARGSRDIVIAGLQMHISGAGWK